MTLTRLIVFFDVHAQKLTWILASLTVVAGGFYSLWLGERLRYIDERDYFTLAENLLQFRAYSSDGINPSAFRPPGYPMLLAAMRLLGAPIFMLRMLNFVALAAIVVLLQRWTVRLFQHRGISVVAAGLPLCYPVLFYTAGALYPQIIAAFLLLVLVERLSRVSIAIRFAHIVHLWSWSQHPNYFGEIVLWIGATIVAIPVLSGWSFLVFASPLLITLQITKVSGINLLDKAAKKKWGDDPEYQEYRRTTSVLVLRPPRS